MPHRGPAQLAWQAWKAYVQRASEYQATVLLNVLYFAVFGPTVLIGRAFGAKFLDLGTQPRASYWLERKPGGKTLADLQRHF